MARWRLWGKPKQKPALNLPSVEEAAEDGEAMNVQAALMALKNRILVQAITGDKSFNPDLYVEPAKEIVWGLVKESRQLAANIQQDILRAQRLRGEARYRNDYRRGDLANLTTRRDTLELIADRLTERLENQKWLNELIDKAHTMAWAEISREMELSLDREEALVFGDENYEDEREKRLREFKNINLAELIEKTQPEY